MNRSITVEGIVLRSRDYGEADRILTLYTKEQGKVIATAKGVRKITSRRSGSLELGNQLRCQILTTKQYGIITQTQLLNSFPGARTSLIRITQLYQVLEIVDILTAEDQENVEVYQLILQILIALGTPGGAKNIMVTNINRILQSLGFAPETPLTESALKNYIEDLAQRKLKSKAYLTPQGELLK